MTADRVGLRRAAHAMPFGAELLPAGGTRFRLWAPSATSVELELQGGARTGLLGLQRIADGWHEILVPEAGPGARYRFLVGTNSHEPRLVPDPASRFNPDGVHGPSEVIDPREYAWDPGNDAWRGRPWEEAVIYELHVGTFTVEGTYASALRRLPQLVDLGITALQIMPLAAFAGSRNWGYDGVLPYATANCYGGPLALKALIDGAHSLSLMVFLDVVYNHFGPDGNYLHGYCPEFFNSAHRTPWGPAINFDGRESRTVRDFFVHNALFWIGEYRFDGLRLDAVHALRDSGTPDIVGEIACALREGPGRERHVHLTLENNRNEARYLARGAGGAPVCATAQWNDDFHHAFHVLLSGETDGYYADYAQAPLAALGRALAEGFAYQGEHSPFRGRPRGEVSACLPPTAFVAFLQNHDMVGNRAFGGRIRAQADLLTAAYACLLLMPQVPMLFMGEEFAASSPFLFFCDFAAELGAAVAGGRLREFKRFAAFADEAAAARIPDPNDPASFAASKLHWEERERGPHRERLELVRELLALRSRYLVPQLTMAAHGGSFEIEAGMLRVQWNMGSASRWRILANFGATAVVAPLPPGKIVFARGLEPPGAGALLASGGVCVALELGGCAPQPGRHVRSLA